MDATVLAARPFEVRSLSFLLAPPLLGCDALPVLIDGCAGARGGRRPRAATRAHAARRCCSCGMRYPGHRSSLARCARSQRPEPGLSVGRCGGIHGTCARDGGRSGGRRCAGRACTRSRDPAWGGARAGTLLHGSLGAAEARASRWTPHAGTSPKSSGGRGGGGVQGARRKWSGSAAGCGGAGRRGPRG